MAIGFPAPTSSGTPAYTLNNPNVDTASAADWFGQSVAVSTSYIAVGAPLEDTATNSGMGVVYIFNASDGSAVQTITNPTYGNTQDNEQFGMRVAINDSYLVVQANGERVNTDDNAGAVHVYDTATWTKQYSIDNPNSLGAASFDNFGYALAIGTTYFAASSVRDSTNNDYAGTVYVFENATGNLVYTINNPTPTANDYFGHSVSISGNYLAIGAHREDTNSGAVYIYDLSNGNQIVRIANPNTIDTSASNDFFGFQVAINSTHLVVSATIEKGDGSGAGGDPANATQAGALYVYNVGSWSTPIYTVRNPNMYGTESSDQFGRALDINSSTILVGVEYEDDASGTNAGAAYTFNLSDGSLINSLPNPNSPTGANERFGRSAAISESNMVIGSLNEFVSVYSLSGGSQTFTFNNRDYIYNSTKGAWEVNSPITVAQTGSPVSDLSELADSTSILSDPANEVLTYADLDAILAVTSPETGQLAFNLDTSDMYIFGGTNWQKVYDEDDVPVVLYWYGDRAVVNNGIVGGTYSNTIEYFDITTLGNASSFGTSTVTGAHWGSVSDTTYAVSARGLNQSTIEYVTIATPGNATNFGTMLATSFRRAGASDGSRGLFANQAVEIEYITIATPGDALSFGNLNFTNGSSAGGSDGTYALWGGTSSNGNNIDYVTIQTAGNGTSFGTLTIGRGALSATSDDTRTIFTGGVDGINNDPTVDYVTTATPGNATDFGDLLALQYNHAATGNSTRAVVIGGEAGGSSNVIQYMTYQTPGNAIDFGDLAGLTSANGATSGSPS